MTEPWIILTLTTLTGLALAILPVGAYDRLTRLTHKRRSRSPRRDVMAEEWVRLDDPYHRRHWRKIP